MVGGISGVSKKFYYRYAWLPGTTDVEYEGWVYKVSQKYILVIFCEEFHTMFPPGSKFNVRFSFNRMALRYMHRALDTAGNFFIDFSWNFLIVYRY